MRPQTSSISAKQLLAAVRKRADLTFLSSLLLAVLGVAVLSLLPDVYRATTTILVDPQKIPEKYVSSTVTTDPNARMNTLTQQVLSASRLQEIIDKDDLYPDLRRRKSREEVLDFMRAKTKIELKQSPEPEQGLSSFSISYEDSNRSQVALVTNQLASSFIDWNLRVRQQQALGTTQFLSSELEKAKGSLEAQEEQLEAFKMRHVGATPDELSGNLQALARLQAETQSNMDAISRLDQERILLAQLKPVDPQTAPLTERGRLLGEKRRLENERWTLKRTFTDTYPDVVAIDEQLRSLNARLEGTPEPTAEAGDSSDPNTRIRLSLLGREIQRHKQQVGQLQGQMQSYQGKVDSVPILETQLSELTRNYEASRQNYQSLLDKTFSAGMSEQLERKQQAERFTVLDPARSPEKPIRPKRLPLLAAILAVASLLPAALIAGLYVISGSVKSEAELREMLPPGIPLLGVIPPIASGADQRSAKRLRATTVVVSLLACAALAVFLLRAKPIL